MTRIHPLIQDFLRPWAIAAGSILFPFILWAADQPLSPDEGVRRQEERARVLQDALNPPPAALKREESHKVSTVLPAESPCFKLNQIVLTGVDIPANPFLGPWLQHVVVAPYVGQCAGVKGVSQVVDAVNAWLVQKGYVTSRAVLPQQNLAAGTLLLQVHMGRVGQVRMVQAGTTTPDRHWGGWRSAFWPLSFPGELLNANDVQQGVDQMNRLPSQQVTTRLEPGEIPDTSDIVIERRAGGLLQRLHGGISVDNSGSKVLGRTQMSLWSSLDNPLGINDLLNINGNTNIENLEASHRSQTLAGSYSVPWGSNTFTWSLSRNQFAQSVAGTTATFLSSGDSTNADMKWQYQWLRTSSAKFGIYSDIGLRRARGYLDDVELLVQRRYTVNLEVGADWQQLLGVATLGARYGFRSGKSWFGAEEDYPDGAGITLRPDIHLFDLNVNVPFAMGSHAYQYSSTLHGQYTRDATIANDQISIGNRYNVRGFDGDNVLLSESGFYWRNEITSALPSTERIKLQGYWGLDAGRVWGSSDINLIGRNLAGTALGVRGQWHRLQADVAVAAPLHNPQGFKTNAVSLYGSLLLAF